MTKSVTNNPSSDLVGVGPGLAQQIVQALMLSGWMRYGPTGCPGWQDAERIVRGCLAPLLQENARLRRLVEDSRDAQALIAMRANAKATGDEYRKMLERLIAAGVPIGIPSDSLPPHWQVTDLILTQLQEKVELIEGKANLQMLLLHAYEHNRLAYAARDAAQAACRGLSESVLYALPRHVRIRPRGSIAVLLGPSHAKLEEVAVVDWQDIADALKADAAAEPSTALRVEPSQEQQMQKEQEQVSRVAPLTAGVVGQDLPQSSNEAAVTAAERTAKEVLGIVRAVRDMLWNKSRSPRGADEAERFGLALQLDNCVDELNLLVESAAPAAPRTPSLEILPCGAHGLKWCESCFPTSSASPRTPPQDGDRRKCPECLGDNWHEQIYSAKYEQWMYVVSELPKPTAPNAEPWVAVSALRELEKHESGFKTLAYRLRQPHSDYIAHAAADILDKVAALCAAAGGPK